MIEDLIRIDDSFSESKFKADVDNIFVQLHISFMMGNLEKIKHFVSEEIYQDYVIRLNAFDIKNERQMYDEFNVKDTIIDTVEILEDRYKIRVTILSRYMDYVINKDSGKLIRGDNTKRIELINKLEYEKKSNTVKQEEARKCASCGAPMDINASGKCVFCGAIYDLAKYDWILTEIDTLR